MGSIVSKRNCHKIFDFIVDLEKEIGDGAFGTVYKGYDKEKKVVEMKKLKKLTNGRPAACTEAVRCHYLKENKVIHDHIVGVYDVKYFNRAMWITMEFCDLGNLNSLFKNHGHTLADERSKVKVMRQIALGIAFLHSKDIIHRDIKPVNILAKSSRNVVIIKLCDFGLSKVLDQDYPSSTMYSNVGTQRFKAPEFWNKYPDTKIRYHRNVDIYAAGLTFVAMMQATPCCTGRSLSEFSLTPIAEGSMEAHERGISIGQAAFLRINSNQTDLNVIEDKENDVTGTRRVKKLIRGMTHSHGRHRLSASEVVVSLQGISSVSIGTLTLFFTVLFYVNTSIPTIFHFSCMILTPGGIQGWHQILTQDGFLFSFFEFHLLTPGGILGWFQILTLDGISFSFFEFQLLPLSSI